MAASLKCQKTCCYTSNNTTQNNHDRFTSGFMTTAFDLLIYKTIVYHHSWTQKNNKQKGLSRLRVGVFGIGFEVILRSWTVFLKPGVETHLCVVSFLQCVAKQF